MCFKLKIGYAIKSSDLKKKKKKFKASFKLKIITIRTITVAMPYDSVMLLCLNPGGHWPILQQWRDGECIDQ